jgi:hypothetical protein
MISDVAGLGILICGERSLAQLPADDNISRGSRVDQSDPSAGDSSLDRAAGLHAHLLGFS